MPQPAGRSACPARSPTCCSCRCGPPTRPTGWSNPRSAPPWGRRATTATSGTASTGRSRPHRPSRAAGSGSSRAAGCCAGPPGRAGSERRGQVAYRRRRAQLPRRRGLDLRRRRRRRPRSGRRGAARGRRRSARVRRPCHQRPRPARLSPRRTSAAPSDRSLHRPAVADALAAGDGVRRHVRGCRCRRQGGVPAGRRRPGLAGRASPARPLPVGRRPSRHQPLVANRAGTCPDMHLTSNPIDWYAARAAGIAAYVLLTAVIALGLALAGKAPGRRWRGWPMFAVEDVHRYGGLLVGTFIAIHVVTIGIDSFLPFSLTQLAVPLAAGYWPIWTGLGIAAAELLLALAITNHYRGRMSHRWWRRAHYENFAVWAAATLHGLGSGTDRNAPWMLTIYIVSTTLVVSLVLWRIAERPGAPARLLPGRRLVVAAVSAAVFRGRAFGPLRVHSRQWNAASFDDHLSGRILQHEGSDVALVSMTGVGHGSQNVLVRADLLVGSTSLQATTFQMEYLPSGLVCKGKVTAVRPLGFDGACMTGGVQRHVVANWRLTHGGLLAGRVTAHT